MITCVVLIFKKTLLKEEYQNISDELFTVEVNAIGVSNITSNFDKMIQFDWDKLNLNVVKKYAHIYQELIKHGMYSFNWKKGILVHITNFIRKCKPISLSTG